MASHTFVVDSTLPPHTAFTQLVDLLRVPEWDRGIRDVRLIGGEPGSAGARYDLTVTGFDGQPTTAVYELTAVDVGRSFTMVGTNPDFRAEDTLTVEPAGDGSRVTYEGGLELCGDNPPLTDEQLDGTFVKVAAVAESGLQRFLNP